MKRKCLEYILSGVCASCLIAILSACGSRGGNATEVAGDAVDTPAAADPMEVTATGVIGQTIRVGKPVRADVSSELTVAARVAVDATRITRIGTPVMGRITSLEVEEGQEVQNGQLLALLNSTGLSGGQLSFLKALSQQMVAQRAVERAHLLLDAGVIGAAELQKREAELAQASAERAAAHDELVLLGMPEPAIAELQRTRALRSVGRIIASMGGTVLHRRITIGQVLQPADTAFEIADLSQLWIEADVPEQQAGNIRSGQAVIAEIPAAPGQRIEGSLSFVSALVDPETRTVKVRMNLPNATRRYKPAMLATLTIKGHPLKHLVVPADAIVRENEQDHVFVRRAGDLFALRGVVTGEKHQNRRVILEGLRDDEVIVTAGAFHLNSERKRRNIRGGE